jgi:Cytochrome C and Quinol oxidase polypeptide I
MGAHTHSHVDTRSARDAATCPIDLFTQRVAVIIVGESRVACALQNSIGSAQGQRTQRQAALPIQAARNDSVCPVDTAQQYKWVIYFFVAVAFWNLVGAGIFGFMINPPIALYYMQGLNTTAVHTHGALYGVYGTLGLGLMLFCLRAMQPEVRWQERWLRFAFWAINIGMMMEILLSLLPIGLLQTYQSVSAGYWSARSPEFMQTGVMQFLRWMRMAGDTIFAIGAVAFGYFVLKLIFRHSKAGKLTERQTWQAGALARP